MKISDQLFAYANEIDTLLADNPTPTENDTLVKRLHAIARSLAGGDSIAAEKSFNIAEQAADYYSAQAHQVSTTETDQQYARMLGWSNSIRTSAKRLHTREL